jgi:phenylalanyl-tRNA synthetase beta chain
MPDSFFRMLGGQNDTLLSPQKGFPMKLSIAWIFDHLEADWKDHDIAQLVAKFNTTTAEVEHFSKKVVDLKNFSLGQVTNLTKDKITVFSPEWQKEFSFEHRPAHEGDVFLITKKDWVTLRDLHGEKEGLIPAVLVPNNDLAGAWKETFETEDYILELDNKSITHRPDMWCHRGFAREVAAILDIPLKPLERFLEKHEVKKYDSTAPATPKDPFSITIKQEDKIKHFAGLYLEQVASEPSLLWMAHRLIKVDSRPISVLVDTTNYVMQDLGQPMHVFDAAKIASKKIEPRLAKKGETIVLLDGQKVELEPTDVVITDGKTPIALAGIMGGKESGMSPDTESAFLEAATFDAATIRKTSSRLKLRTDASARFEKSLDPHLNVLAVQRFLKIIHDAPLTVKISSAIASIGHETQPPVVELEHSFIESRLGEKVTSAKIKEILEKLEFGVQEQKKGSDVLYAITIPTFRATKDIALKEDIVEEVGRFVGYASIPLILPAMSMRPKDLIATRSLRTIKHHLAYVLAMHEVHNYAFFDEEFLPRLNWQPTSPVSMKNPVSEHWKTLVSSLIPHLLKNVYQNETKEDRLRFFESGRVWSLENKTVHEQKSVAGILFDRKEAIDFYQAKAELTTLFEALELELVWEKPNGQIIWTKDNKFPLPRGVSEQQSPWYNQHQTAVLMHKGLVIGIAGKIESSMLSRVVSGDAFAFELNGDFLTSYHPAITKFTPLSKYPVVWLDISMLVPLQVTVTQLKAIIMKADERITQVELVDFFEKEEWKDQRSLTFRYYVQDKEKTLEKDDIDTVSRTVEKSVQALGVKIR